MAREDLHFRLRIPDEIKQRIEVEAASNNRSMTAEIISRLERSFEPALDAERVARLELENKHLRSLRRVHNKQIRTSEKLEYHLKAMNFLFADMIRRYTAGDEKALDSFIENERNLSILGYFEEPEPIDDTDQADDELDE